VSDKELALDSIWRLPENVRLETIVARLEFLATVRQGLDQIEQGEIWTHEDVKRELASWLAK
jgi:predicted transcriptional regulator